MGAGCFRSDLKPVVMLFNGRGDYLMALPTLRALSFLFAGELTLIAKKGAREVFFPDLIASRLIEPNLEYNSNGPEFDASALAEEIGPTALFISLNPWHTPSMKVLLTQLNEATTIGFFSDFDIQLPLDFSKHSSDLMFDVVKSLAPELSVENFAETPVMKTEYQEFAAGLIHKIPGDRRVLIIHGDTLANKVWIDERFVELIEMLMATFHNLIVFDLGLKQIGGTSLETQSRVISCKQLVLPSAIALVGLSDFFIGVDSCFLHAADMYRVPGIGLFGTTSPHEFGFRFGPHRHVAKSDMSLIEVPEVYCAIKDLLEECQPIEREPRHERTIAYQN